MKKLISTNPANNYSVVGEVSISDAAEITEKVRKAQAAKTAWKELGIKKRIDLLRPIGNEFAKRQEEIAKLITQETGKPIQQSRSEVKGGVEKIEWFMNNVGLALEDEVTHEDKDSIHKIVYEPFGVAAVITPWNFPFSMAIWGIVPNLLVGNTAVFKISEECPLVGKLIEETMLNHNLPEGVFAEVYGTGDIGKKLSEGDVDLIWFTGSTKVGKALYKTAAHKFIKAILEMGGSNPFLVFEDVNLSSAAELIYDERFQNCGQVCDATKRLIVHELVAEKLTSELKKVLESTNVGDPEEEQTGIASLVAKRQLDLLKEQVDDALVKGAKVIAQKTLSKNLKGAFYPPTLLGDVTKNMRVWKEEVFGPVLPIVTFKTEEEAIGLANDTPYGLGSRVLSKDDERAQRVASRIEAGTVEINEGSRWLSCNPFGGYKSSGMGREHGVLGFRELSQVKVISSSK